VAPRADCDESTFTGCETDLDLDVEHCGACRSRCIGVCVSGQCHPFEVLMRNVELPMHGGIAFGLSDVYALSTSPSELLRRGRQGGPVQPVITGPPDFQRMILGYGRLYLFGDGLWSVSNLGGSDLRSELPNVSNAVHCGSWLYFLDDTDGRTYRRNDSSHAIEPLDVAPPGTVVDFACALDRVVLVAHLAQTWVLYANSGPESNPWRKVADIALAPRQVRATPTAIYVSVILSEAPAPQEIWEVRLDGTTRVLFSGAEIVDFLIDGGRLYVSSDDGREDGARLSILPIASPELGVLLRLRYRIRTLEIAEQALYFGEEYIDALSRLPLWLR